MIKMINEKMIKLYIKLTTDTKYILLVYVSYFIAIISITSIDANAADGDSDILTGFKNLINDLRKEMVSLSTPAAVVGVGSGALLKKFSLGKMDRIETGNKIITNSIWGWILINGSTSILNWVGKYFGAKA
jgi:hypothetical protein